MFANSSSPKYFDYRASLGALVQYQLSLPVSCACGSMDDDKLVLWVTPYVIAVPTKTLENMQIDCKGWRIFSSIIYTLREKGGVFGIFLKNATTLRG
jgi:hypothetical protein